MVGETGSSLEDDIGNRLSGGSGGDKCQKRKRKAGNSTRRSGTEGWRLGVYYANGTRKDA